MGSNMSANQIQQYKTFFSHGINSQLMRKIHKTQSQLISLGKSEFFQKFTTLIKISLDQNKFFVDHLEDIYDKVQQKINPKIRSIQQQFFGKLQQSLQQFEQIQIKTKRKAFQQQERIKNLTSQVQILKIELVKSELKQIPQQRLYRQLQILNDIIQKHQQNQKTDNNKIKKLQAALKQWKKQNRRRSPFHDYHQFDHYHRNPERMLHRRHFEQIRDLKEQISALEAQINQKNEEINSLNEKFVLIQNQKIRLQNYSQSRVLITIFLILLQNVLWIKILKSKTNQFLIFKSKGNQFFISSQRERQQKLINERQQSIKNREEELFKRQLKLVKSQRQLDEREKCFQAQISIYQFDRMALQQKSKRLQKLQNELKIKQCKLVRIENLRQQQK